MTCVVGVLLLSIAFVLTSEVSLFVLIKYFLFCSSPYVTSLSWYKKTKTNILFCASRHQFCCELSASMKQDVVDKFTAKPVEQPDNSSVSFAELQNVGLKHLTVFCLLYYEPNNE